MAYFTKNIAIQLYFFTGDALSDKSGVISDAQQQTGFLHGHPGYTDKIQTRVMGGVVIGDRKTVIVENGQVHHVKVEAIAEGPDHG